MKKFKKQLKFNIVVIFVLTTIFLCSNIYASSASLRVPVGINENRSEEAISILEGDIIFKTLQRNFKVVRLTEDNIKKYRQDVFRVTGEDQDFGRIEAVEEALMRMEKDFSYIVMADRRVAGCILCGQIKDKKKDNILYIYSIGIDKQYKGEGIGNAIIWMLAKEAQKKGIAGIETDVAFGNDMVDFLIERGFKLSPSIILALSLLKAEVSSVIQKTEEYMRKNQVEFISSNHSRPVLIHPALTNLHRQAI